jgi:hypothetical protein
MSRKYSIVSDGEESSITVYIPGENPLLANNTHPNYDEIVIAVVDEDLDYSDEELIDLFDVAQTAAKYFKPLSERVSVANGRVYLDNDEVNDSLSKQIVRFLNEGIGDWTPLVRFLENVAQNPHPHSREQLYDWLSRRDFTIDQDGYIVAYKGVTVTENGFQSVHSGRAIVDGEVVNGYIPNPLGSVIEMPRLEVHHDPSVGCSTGLHVGNWRYANSFAGTVLEVHVNPRDVVSVPTDSDWEKIRVCRYYVADVIHSEIQSAYFGADVDDDEDEDVDYDALNDDNNCGDLECCLCYPEQYEDEEDEEDEDNYQLDQEAEEDRYPSIFDWDALLQRQKSRKQSIVKLAEAQGWKLIDPDEPKNRTSWAV